MNIKTENYKKKGMYLLFPDGHSIDLSEENIKRLGDEYWNDPAKLPPSIRHNDDFKTCTVCPFRGQDVLCSAIKPLLPFLEEMENFVSYDKVTAVYLREEGFLYVRDTQMQNALQYVTNMSTFQYCEDMKKYHKYFNGITPFMGSDEIVRAIFLNVYYLSGGNKGEMDRVIKELLFGMTVTGQGCVKRLNLMCKSDAFKNAYVKTQVYTMMLSALSEKDMGEFFEKTS